jgi:large subunit ribosomal protein L29
MSQQADKFRNLGPDELKVQERDQMDQLFRLKFQMKMGQTESLNKVRTLRRNVARLKTLRREHELGIAVAAPAKAEAKSATKAKKTSTKSKAAGTQSARKAGKK